MENCFALAVFFQAISSLLLNRTYSERVKNITFSVQIMGNQLNKL